MSRFGEGLEYLKVKLLEMSSVVENGIQRSMDAVMRNDPRASDEVFKGETRINAIELEIDALAIELLALHQPMAGDLRFIVAALKMTTDLERMGDLSLAIAHTAKSLESSSAIGMIVDIPLIARLVQGMVRKSLDAFASGDSDLAFGVLSSDDAVDDLRNSCYQQLVSFMKEDPKNIRLGIDLLTVIRTLERLADHATNIAEDVLFFVKGVDVRHQGAKI